MVPSFRLALLLVSLGGLLAACARGESAEERQLAELRDEVTRVQADHDRFDQRIGALEIQADSERSSPPRGARAAAAAPTPELRVVRLGPAAAEPDVGDDVDHAAEPAPSGSDDPDDASPRPVIRVVGAAGRGGSLPRSGARPSALDPEARRAYEAALALVKARKYPEALDALAGFLIKWPDHPNADNAMYWRGECYFAQGDFDRAAEQFEGTVARFPLGNKAPDALLKLGISAGRLGQADRAKTAFDRLDREFPRSEAARHVPSATGAASPASHDAVQKDGPKDRKVSP